MPEELECFITSACRSATSTKRRVSTRTCSVWKKIRAVPAFDFGGAWYKLGDRGLHLIVPKREDHPPSHWAKRLILTTRISRSVYPVSPRGHCLFGVQRLSEDHRPESQANS